MLKGKTVVLGVTGSIAAYKIANLASMLVKKHANVHVIMTENACNFINPITFETLTGNKCLVDTFDRNFQFNVEHVSLAKLADIFLVAPASADVIGKIANGIADDMLTTTIMACKCPKLISPAMNTNMFTNPIVQDNLKKLEAVEDREYFKQTTDKIIRTREWTKEELKKLGFLFEDSKSNFVFVTHPKVSAKQLFENLKKENVYVRYFAKPERISNYLRITIGTDEEMQKLLSLLKKYC